MKCPSCNNSDTKVLDTRISKDGRAIRRRRECNDCQQRFTTHERIEEFQPLVIKKDGRREAYNRIKVIDGILKACEKRPVSIEQIEAFVMDFEREAQDNWIREIPTRVIGEKIMEFLKTVDQVAYVRFASVYKQFKDLHEFMQQLEELLNQKKNINTNLT